MFNNQKISELRDQRTLSDMELAVRMHQAGGKLHNPRTICNWREGKFQPKARDLWYLAKALGVGVGEFFGERTDQQNQAH